MNSPKTVLTAVVSAAVATSVFAAPSQATPLTASQTSTTSPSTTGTTTAAERAAAAAAAKKAAAKKAAAKKAAKAKAKKVAKAKKIRAKRKAVRVRAVKALKVAHKKAGARYSYGSTGPHTFDCSGLTSWAYKKVGKKLPRTSGAQAAAVTRTKKPAKGDLVFFHRGGRVYHVGLYAGKGKVFHASRSGVPVKTDRIWTKQVFYGRVAA